MLVICGEADDWCKKQNCVYARSVELSHIYKIGYPPYIAAESFINMDIPWHVQCKIDEAFVAFLQRYVKE